MNKIFLIVIGIAVLAFFMVTSQKGLPTQPQPTPAPSKAKVKIFLVSLEDKGKQGKKIGCDDSLISQEREITSGDKVEDKIKGALEALFAFKDIQAAPSDIPGGVYSALANADVKVDVTLAGGKAKIDLAGALRSGGVCDDPRVEEQLKATVLQFPEIKEVEIFINGRLLEEELDAKGGE